MSEGETTLLAIDAEAKHQSVHGRRCGQAHHATHGEPESFSFRNEGVPSSILRSIVSPLYAVLPLQGGDLGAITGGAQRGTFGGTRGRALGGVERPGWCQTTHSRSTGIPPFRTTQRWGRRGVHARQESTADTAIMSKSPTRGQRQVWRTRAARISSIFSGSITVSPCTQHPSGRGTSPPASCARGTPAWHARQACPCRPRRPGVTGAVADKTTGRAHPLFLRPHSVDRFWTERLINPWCS